MNDIKTFKIKYFPKEQYIRFIIFLFILILTSCQATITDKAITNKQLEKLAMNKFGTTKVTYLRNGPGNYIVCMQKIKPTAQKPFHPLHFFIYSDSTKDIIFEDNIANGSLQWLNDYQVRVTIIPGIIKAIDETPPGYLFDVRKKKKLEELRQKEHR